VFLVFFEDWLIWVDVGGWMWGMDVGIKESL